MLVALRTTIGFGAALLCCTAESLAAEGDTSLALAAGARWVEAAGMGPNAELQLGSGIAESWLLLGSLGASHQPKGDPSVLSAGLGLGWRWDVIQWVPEVGLQLRAYEFLGNGAPTAMAGFEWGASAHAAIDHLLSRNWALGVVGQGHALFTAADRLRVPMLDAGLRVRYQWD